MNDHFQSYWFYNTDAKAFNGQTAAQKLLKRGFAVTGGPERFGKLLGKLSQGDTLLMYENKVGVLAVGTVREEWDGQTHINSWYYPKGEPHEYRIKVDWYMDFTSYPIDYPTLRERIGYIPRGALRKDVNQHSAIEALIADWQPKGEIPKSRPKKPGRSECTTQRIIRDTGIARIVKEIHSFHCQICGHRTPLPNGSYYAEAHHICPLGAPHDGYDVLENILCVCPNHHAELDYLSLKLSLDKIRKSNRHQIDPDYIEHHNKRCDAAKGERKA